MRTFKEYNGSDYYQPEGITNTLDFFDPDKNMKQELLEKISKKPIFMLWKKGIK